MAQLTFGETLVKQRLFLSAFLFYVLAVPAAYAADPGCVPGKVVALRYPPTASPPPLPAQQQICYSATPVPLDDVGGVLAILDSQLAKLAMPSPTTAVDRWADCALARAVFKHWVAAGRREGFDAYSPVEADKAEDALREGLGSWARRTEAAPELSCTLPANLPCGGTISPQKGETTGTYQVAIARAWRHWKAWWPQALRSERARRHAETIKIARVEGKGTTPPPPTFDEDLAKGAACTARTLADEIQAYHAAFTLAIQTLGPADCEHDAPPHPWGISQSLRCELQATVDQIERAVPTLQSGGSLTTAAGMRSLALTSTNATVAVEMRTRSQKALTDLRAAIADKQLALRARREATQLGAHTVVTNADSKVAPQISASLGPEFDVIQRGKGYCLLGQWKPGRSKKFSYEIVVGIPAPGAVRDAVSTDACTGSETPVLLLSTGKAYVDVERLADGRARFSQLARDTRESSGAISSLLRELGLPEIIDVVGDAQQTWTEFQGLPSDKDFKVVLHFGLGVSWLPGSERAVQGKVVLSRASVDARLDLALENTLRELETRLQRRLREGVAIDSALGWVQVSAAGQAPPLVKRKANASPPRFHGRLVVRDPTLPEMPWLTAAIELGLERKNDRWRLVVVDQNLGTAALLDAARDALERRPELQAIDVAMRPYVGQLRARGAQTEGRWKLTTISHAEVTRDRTVTFAVAWRVPGFDGPQPPRVHVIVSEKDGVRARIESSELSRWVGEAAAYLAVNPKAITLGALTQACAALQAQAFGSLTVEVDPRSCGSEDRPVADVRIVGFAEGRALLLRNVRLVHSGGNRLDPSLSDAEVLWGERGEERPVDGRELQDVVTALVGNLGWLEHHLTARLAHLEGHVIWFAVSLDVPYLGTVDAGRVGFSLRDGLVASGSIRASLQSAISRAIQEHGSQALQGLVGDGARINNVKFIEDGAQVTVAVPIPDLGSDLTLYVHLPSGRISADADKSLADAALKQLVGVFAGLLEMGDNAPKIAIDTTQRPIALAVTANVDFSGLSIQLPKILISQRGIKATWPVVIPFKGVQINMGPFAFVDPALHLDGTKKKESLGLGGKLTLLTQGLDLILHMDTLAKFQLRHPYTLSHSGHTVLFDTIPMFASSGEINLAKPLITSRNSSAGPLRAIIDFGESSAITNETATFGGSLTILGIRLGKADITLGRSRKVEAKGFVDLLVGRVTMTFTADPFPEKMRLESSSKIGVGDFSITLNLVATANNVEIRFSIFGVDIELSVSSLKQVTPKLLLDAILALFDFKLEDLLKNLTEVLKGGKLQIGGRIGDGGSSADSGDSARSGSSKQGGTGQAGESSAPKRSEEVTGTGTGGEQHLNQYGPYALYHVAAGNCVARVLHSGQRVIVEGIVSTEAADLLRGGSLIGGRFDSIDFSRGEGGWISFDRGTSRVRLTVPGVGALDVPYTVADENRAEPFGIVASGADADLVLHAVQLRPMAPCDGPVKGGWARMSGLRPADILPGWQRRAWAASDPVHQFAPGDAMLLEAEARAALLGALAPVRPEFARVALPMRSGGVVQPWFYRWREQASIRVLPRNRTEPLTWDAGSFLGRWLMGQEEPSPRPGGVIWWSAALEVWSRSNAEQAPAGGLPWTDVLADALSAGALPQALWPTERAPMAIAFAGYGARDARLWTCPTADACTSVRSVGEKPLGLGASAAAPALVALTARSRAGTDARDFVWTGRPREGGRVFHVIGSQADLGRLRVIELAPNVGGSAAIECGTVDTARLVATEARQPPGCQVRQLGETVDSWARWLWTRERSGPDQPQCINPVLRLKQVFESESCQ